MLEVEIFEFVRTIAESEGRYDPDRHGLAHSIAIILKQLTENGDVIVRATDQDADEMMERIAVGDA